MRRKGALDLDLERVDTRPDPILGVDRSDNLTRDRRH